MTASQRITSPVAERDEREPKHNPYWDAVKDLVTTEDARSWEPGALYVGGIHNWEATKDRFERTSEYAWTITSPESVAFVAEHAGPSVIDPMAGSGYWAYLLGQLGIDVQASDIKPGDSQWHQTGTWVDVASLDAVTAVSGAHPSRVLLLSWPPYDQAIGASVLAAFRGDRVVYIGEGEGGCCGDDAMFSLLEQQWTEVADHRPVQWYGLHDWITVYDRKAVTQ